MPRRADSSSNSGAQQPWGARNQDPVALHDAVISWYSLNARELPWRGADVSPWGVMVSEFMLQQTPVARVLPVWQEWIDRWPTPTDLAREAPGTAVRAWGRLGYPRRALRLHEAATVLRDDHGGQIPTDVEQLQALPGVGEYTSAAIASFAYRQRHAVLDTNVRRVLHRLVDGVEYPPTHLSNAERALARELLPDTDEVAATWAIGLMELGALICTARNPVCGACPVRDRCAWVADGSPAHAGPARKGQKWVGTDRMARGAILAVLRDSDRPVSAKTIEAAWPDAIQRARALDSLVADGLVEPLARSRYQLPQ